MYDIIIANDHAGYQIKLELIQFLSRYEILDLGCNSCSSVDYNDFAQILAQKLYDTDHIGILICGSGIGMSIAVNRYPWIRGALCTSIKMAELARQHNDANVLIIGSKITSLNQIKKIIITFINTKFSNEIRHQQRINKLSTNKLTL
jgi:ribose 5-phosphate isomerase B